MKWRFRLPQHLSRPSSCASIEPLLSLYSDGMTSPREARQVEDHLAACPDCRRALNWMQATRFVISHRPPALPPPDLRARIARALAETETSPIRVRTTKGPVVLRPALLAAAASLTVAAILTTHPLHTAPRRAGTASPMQVAQLPATGSSEAAARQLKAQPTPKAYAAPPSQATVAPPMFKARPKVADQIARAPIVASDDDSAPGRVGLAAAHARSLTPVPPAGPVHVAAGPTDRPRAATPVPAKSVLVATKLPETPIGRKTEDAVVTSAPELAPLSSPKMEAEADRPDAARVAVAVPALTHPVRVDVLSGVRASLSMLPRAPVKVYRDSSPRFQTAAYSPNSRFVQAATDYTPTTLPDTKPAPEH